MTSDYISFLHLFNTYTYSHEWYKTAVGIERGFSEVDYVILSIQGLVVFLKKKVHEKLVNKRSGIV